MKTERPVNLNLLKLRFPIMAIVSILHRISGIVIFLALPVLLYILHASLVSQTSYEQLMDLLQTSSMRCLMIIILSASLYHLLAGIRHLIMDCGYFEEQVSGRISAWLMIGLTMIAVAYVGVWLW